MVIAEEIEQALDGPAGLCRWRRRRSPCWEEGRAAERAAEMLVVVEPPVQAALVEHVAAVPQLPHRVPSRHLAQAHRARDARAAGPFVFLLARQVLVGRDAQAGPHRRGEASRSGCGVF